MDLPSKEIFNKLKGRHLDVLSVQKVIDYDKALDSYFKIDFELEKKSEIKEENFYTHQNLLNEEALNTSYFDFYQILEALPPQSSIVDVGAGYARMALLNDYLGLSHKIISIEAVKERLVAAKSYCDKRHEFVVQDILHENFHLPKADYYFLYLPTGRLFEKVLEEILQIAQTKKVRVIGIESHGNLIDFLTLNRVWLREMPLKLALSLPRHKNSIYFYESIDPLEVTQFNTRLEQDKKDVTFSSESLYLALSYFKAKNYKALAKIVPIGGKTRRELFELRESEFYINQEGEIFVQTKYPKRLLRLRGDDEVIEKIIK